MGYILPIQQDTYTQYVNRSVSRHNHYSHIFPTEAIPSIHNNSKDERAQKEQTFAEVLEGKIKKAKGEQSFLGKGKHVNLYG